MNGLFKFGQIWFKVEASAAMSDLFLLTKSQFFRIQPYFPLAHRVVRVDDMRVISGIIDVIKHGLQWKDVPKDYGPHKTLYNRFIRWRRIVVFNRIFAALAGKAGTPDRLMIDATHLKAYRAAAILLKKRIELEAACHCGWQRPAAGSVPDRRPGQ
jgi:transposase